MSEKVMIPEFLKKLALEKSIKTGLTLAQFLSLIESETKKIACREFFNKNGIFRIRKKNNSLLYERCS